MTSPHERRARRAKMDKIEKVLRDLNDRLHEQGEPIIDFEFLDANLDNDEFWQNASRAAGVNVPSAKTRNAISTDARYGQIAPATHPERRSP